MKQTLPIALTCFALGFACAWMLRTPKSAELHSSAQQSAGSATASAVPQALSADASIEKSTSLPRTARKPGSSSSADKPKKEAKDFMDESQKMITTVLEKNDKAALDKLVRNLHLNPQQQEKVRALLEERRKSLGLGIVNFDGVKQDPAIAEQLKPSKFDEALMQELTAEQKTALTDLRQQERSAKVDSNTLKSLSRITEAITLSEEQRGAIYETLAAEEGRKLDNETVNIPKMMMESMGMGGADDLGLHDATMDPSFAEKMANAGGDNPDSMGQVMREILTKKVEDHVNLVSPHLNDQQRVDYRKHQLDKIESAVGMMSGFSDQEE